MTNSRDFTAANSHTYTNVAIASNVTHGISSLCLSRSDNETQFYYYCYILGFAASIQILLLLLVQMIKTDINMRSDICKRQTKVGVQRFVGKGFEIRGMSANL